MNINIVRPDVYFSQDNLGVISLGSVVVQAVVRRPFTVEAQVPLQAIPCEICVGHSGTRRIFILILQLSPVSTTAPKSLFIHLPSTRCSISLASDIFAE
jgi:hypothetical protein